MIKLAKTIPPGLAAFIAKRKDGASSGPPMKKTGGELANAAASRLKVQRDKAMFEKKNPGKKPVMAPDYDNDGD